MSRVNSAEDNNAGLKQVDSWLDTVEVNDESDPDGPLAFQRAPSFGPEAYAFDPASKFMKKPVGAPGDRLIVGINPGSHEIYKVAKERTALCTQLLDQISCSMRVFRPSESLYNLDQMVYDNNRCSDRDGQEGLDLDDDNNEETMLVYPVEEDISIDVVLSGGGLKGYFMVGAGNILQKELDKRKMKIARIAGASAGSWAGMFMLTGVSSEAWIETYFANQIRPGSTLLEAYQELWPQVRAVLPQDAYKQCSGRLFISLTKVTIWGVENVMISEFSSNEDLFNCCCASSTIPYMSIPRWFWYFRGEPYLDGGLTNNTPVFPNGERRQLVFRLYEVEYPWRQMLTPIDTCIETLVLRGAILMSRFLQGEPTDSITWLEKQQKKEDLPQVKKTWITRTMVVPIVIGGYIVARGTGLSLFLRGVMRSGGASMLVPFSEAGNLFGTSTLKYIATVSFARIVDILRHLQFLL